MKARRKTRKTPPAPMQLLALTGGSKILGVGCDNSPGRCGGFHATFQVVRYPTCS